MAEKDMEDINSDDSDDYSDPKPERGRDLCRMKTFEGGDYGGFIKDILTENFDERDKAVLICAVCNGIMKDACISTRGEQFCSCCCENSISKGPNAAIRKTINSLKCCCPLIERGCKWFGTLEDCENHLDTCGYVDETCKRNCGEVLRREEFERHEKENCSQRQVKCGHCDENLRSCQLNGHLSKCSKMKVSCDLCDTRISRSKLELHLRYDCDMVQETCNLGCGMELTRDELRTHEKYNCPQRQVKCDYCDDNFKSHQHYLHHGVCPKMNVSCNLCGTKITRENMELHFRYDCGMLQETCRLGCGAELTRNELRIHEKENCPQRQVKCDHCDNNFTSCQLYLHHDVCPKMSVSCNLCGTKITREDMELHLRYHCGIVQERCRLGCGAELTRDELRFHEKENCPERQVKCDYCDDNFKSYQLYLHHDVCRKMKVSCNLCGRMITREDMELHLRYHCGIVQERCRLGCGVELTRNKLRIHEKDNCTQRILQCEYCFIEVIFCDNPKHLKECPKMKVLCDLCNVEKCRKDMKQHLKDDCPEKMIDCPFVKYECLARIKRKDIDKHLEEKETEHLGLKLTAMEDLINTQSEEIDKQSEEINKQSEEICKLDENVEKQNKEMKTEKSSTSQQIGLLFSITDTTKMIWKIEDVRFSLDFSMSQPYEVAGYKFAFKFHYYGRLSIVFPGTTIKTVRPFIARCHIMLHSCHTTINCGIIEFKQKDVLKGCERSITSISKEDINKYSEPQFPDATKRDLTLEIFLTMQ